MVPTLCVITLVYQHSGPKIRGEDEGRGTLQHERPVVQAVVSRKGLGGGAQSTAYSLRPVSWWRCGAQCARLLPASLLWWHIYPTQKARPSG